MTDECDHPMRVTLHKENEPDFSVEESAFDTVGMSVDNAVPIDELKALADGWREMADDNAGNLDWKFIHNRVADKLEEVLQQYE